MVVVLTLFMMVASSELAGGRPDDLVNPSRCNTRIGGFASGPLDPGAPGPFKVAFTEYDFGDEAFVLDDLGNGVEERARVAYPEDLGCGPFPIVFVLHGGNETCFDAEGDVSADWPCEAGFQPIPNYRGYDYLTKILASHGVVAVSISANGIFAASGGAQHRAQLVQRHMEIWQELSGAGGPPFGNLFRGRVDLQRVGTLGHSLGGEGVLFHVHHNEAQGSPFGLRAVFVIGATDHQQGTVVNGVPLGVLLPYCDGDQEVLPAIRYFDQSRYNQPGDPAPKHTFEVIGANHANYNTFWDPEVFEPGTVDDWEDEWFQSDPFCNLPDANPASGRLTGSEQRATATALVGAFFREYVRKEPGFRSFLRGDAPPPPSAGTDEIYVAYHPADDPESRRDVNRFTSAGNLQTSTQGGAVTAAGLARFEWCDPWDGGAVGCLENLDQTPVIGRDGRAPHAFQSGLTQLRLAWTGGAGSLTHAIPEGSRDVTPYRVLQFRAAVDFTDPLNAPGAPQDFTVELVDGAGLSASTPVSAHSPALFYPPSENDPAEADTSIPRAVLNTVRIPLNAFEGVFLQDVREVRLFFDQVASGALDIADLAFADETTNRPPTVAPSVDAGVLEGGGEKLTNVGLEMAVADDHDQNPVVSIDVFSDEDDVDSGVQQRSPDAKDLAAGTLRLRAEADNNEDGRVYLIVARSTDSEGRFGFGCTTVVVPDGQQEEDLADVLTQAAATQAACIDFAAAAEGLAPLPGGFFIVGDGPVLGPDQ